MKTVKHTLLALAAVFGLAAASQATVIVDDTWASGTYTNWSLPAQCPWYFNNSNTNLYLGAVPGALICTNFDSSDLTLVTGTRNFWTYFTTNAPELTIPYMPPGALPGSSNYNVISASTNCYYGYPVDIDVGQMVTVTLRFVPSGYLMDTLGSKGLRLGLLCYDTNTPQGRITRDSANISKSGTNVTGYLLEIPLCLNLANNSMFSFRVRTNLNGMADSIDPLGKTSTYLGLGGGPSLTNVPGFQLDQEYTLQWSVARYATANEVSANISGPMAGVAFTNFSRSYMDTSGSNYHRFDHFQMRIDGAYLVTDRLVLKQFKVETLPIPPFNITTAHPIDSDNFRLAWQSLDGQKYRIESKDDLNTATWSSNDTVTATGTTTTWTNTGLSGINTRFYRVVNTP